MISITEIKGRCSSCLCIWFQRNKKIYIIESNDDHDSDNDWDNDWDKGELINGNKQIQRIYRRQGVLRIFNPDNS